MTTLYVSDIKTSIALSSRHLNLYRDNDDGKPELRSRLPLHCLDRVAIVGRSRVSMRAVNEFMRRDVPVHVFEPCGRHNGSFLPHRDGDAFLRIRQYGLHTGTWALDCAQSLIKEKLMTSRRVVQRLAARDHCKSAEPEIDMAVGKLRALAKRIPGTRTFATLRGIEGAGSATYFSALGCLFPHSLCFTGRNRRPPRDPINALLSWAYTLVAVEFRGAITAAGLDPCIGFYHSLGYGRPALALDLMETFRAPLCDMLAVRLLNLGVLKASDFENTPETGCRLGQVARDRFFKQYEKRMSSTFRVAGRSSPVSYRDLIRYSVDRYVEALKEGEPYRPFQIR